MKKLLCAAFGVALLGGCMGCGWSSRASRENTRTGISESGYPKGSPADPGSPVMGTMKREKEKKEK